MNEVDVFKALADPTRLKILECIKDGEKCICEVIPYTGKSQPNVSQHLKVLKIAGLVDERREGTRILLKASNKKIFDVIDSVKKLR
ncbi:MAG: metalloregulator ArsR/SmtB family transcription factor [Euryarchaeota archaeon]|jgi:DNA-binding transcriptional ArsR family regulator|nr:metalloregulator ArsR/SmtB family transcription factor [Euryarchaeota archaeon]